MHGPTNTSPEHDQLLDTVLAEYLRQVEVGAAPDRREVASRHPELAADLAHFFADQDRIEEWAGPLRTLSASPGAGLWPAEPTLEGRRLGDYELLEEISHGGMGVVYKARHVALNRTVAVKMISIGRVAGPDDVARLRREAAVTARLDHPHIVPIWEVGEVEGQAFFSMKLMEGGSLAHHLARFQADQRATASLLVEVARAVHHAHQRGILHRDLKPSNILLDADSQPHVGDFGLAKFVESSGELTLSGNLVGTPAYMAPEQAAPISRSPSAQGEQVQRGVTTASDVYSLGAILYAMLTGRPPFQGLTPLDTLVLVREQDPEPLSRCNPTVDRDLEAICLKCLEKEPARRYGSAEALAEDLERWLTGEPIVARPLGRIGRAWRWCRRNPVLAGLGAGVAGSLLCVSIIATFAVFTITAARNREMLARNAAEAIAEKEHAERLRAEQAEQQANVEATRANTEAFTARQLAQFLLGIFQSSDPFGYENLGFRADSDSNQKLLARDLLDRAAERIDAEFKEPTQTKAALLDSIGNVYRSLGIFDKAELLLQQALEIRTNQLPPHHPDLATSFLHLGRLWQNAGDYSKAKKLYLQAIAIREQHYGPKHLLVAEAKFYFGWLQADLKNPRGAEALYKEVLEVRVKELGAEHPQVGMVRVLLAIVLIAQNKHAEALQVSLANVAPSEVVQGGVLYQTAVGYRKQKKFAASEKAYRELLTMSRRTLGDRHPMTILYLGDFAGMLRDKGDLQESERVVLQMLEFGRTFMNDHPLVAEVRFEYAKALLAHRRFAEAEKLFHEGLTSARKKALPQRAQAKAILEHLVKLYELWGKPEKAAEQREQLSKLMK